MDPEAEESDLSAVRQAQQAMPKEPMPVKVKKRLILPIIVPNQRNLRLLITFALDEQFYGIQY
jgi:hypothetical protein